MPYTFFSMTWPDGMFRRMNEILLVFKIFPRFSNMNFLFFVGVGGWCWEGEPWLQLYRCESLYFYWSLTSSEVENIALPGPQHLHCLYFPHTLFSISQSFWNIFWEIDQWNLGLSWSTRSTMWISFSWNIRPIRMKNSQNTPSCNGKWNRFYIYDYKMVTPW